MTKYKLNDLAKYVPILALVVISTIIIIVYMIFFSGKNKEVFTTSGQKIMMSTSIIQQAYDADKEKSQEMISKTYDFLKDFENKVSLYIIDSEIQQINNMAGVDYVKVSDETYNMINKSIYYCELSDGDFDITIAPIMHLWNIMYGGENIPSDQEISDILELVDYKNVLLDDENKSVMLSKKGMKIDLGAVAKGYACDLAREIYSEYGLQGSMLSMGGSNVLTMGYPRDDKRYFSVGIRDPRGNNNDLIGILNITDKNICSSGDYERYFEKDGVRYHHIFDPSTGKPAQTDLISVTVITENAFYSEYLSTSLFIKGKDYVLDNYKETEELDYEFIIVDNQMNIYLSRNLKNIFTETDKEQKYNYIFLD